MKRIFTAAAMIAVMLTSVALAQEEQPSATYEHLKAYEPYIGTWRCEGEVEEEVVGGPKKGTPFVIEASWKWILDKSVIEEQWKSTAEDGTVISGKNLVGWDPKTETIFVRRTNSAGGYDEGTVEFDDEKGVVISKASGISGDGKEYTGTCVITPLNPDEFTFQVCDRTGQFTGDGPKLTFGRVGQTDTTSHDRLEERLGWLVGEWEGEGPSGAWRWTIKWSGEDGCLSAPLSAEKDGEMVVVRECVVFWDSAIKNAKFFFIGENRIQEGMLLKSDDQKLIWGVTYTTPSGVSSGMQEWARSGDELTVAFKDIELQGDAKAVFQKKAP